MPTANTSFDILGWYGAIVSTGTLVLYIYSTLKDRARVAIKYETDQYLLGDGARVLYNQKDEKQKYVIITVINRGRRPIKIEQAAIKIFKQSKWSIIADSFSVHRPKIINEESPQTTFIAEQQLIDLKNVIYVRVKDGTGKVHKKYIKKFPSFYLTIDWLRNKFIKDENNK